MGKKHVLIETEYTVTPQEQAKDKRLRKTYGWTLAMYYALERLQDGRCAGCGREPRKAPLQVDHFHFHITAMRGPRTLGEAGIKQWDGWNATTVEISLPYFWAKTKIEAIKLAREAALPLSVRGLLCPGRHGTGCNTKLGRIDNPGWLRKMADYLENPPARQILNSKENVI